MNNIKNNNKINNVNKIVNTNIVNTNIVNNNVDNDYSDNDDENNDASDDFRQKASDDFRQKASETNTYIHLYEQFIKNGCFKYIDPDRQTQELCDYALSIDPLNLQYCKDEFKNFNMCYDCLKKNCLNYKYIPIKFLNDMRIKNYIINVYYNNTLKKLNDAIDSGDTFYENEKEEYDEALEIIDGLCKMIKL